MHVIMYAIDACISSHDDTVSELHGDRRQSTLEYMAPRLLTVLFRTDGSQDQTHLHAALAGCTLGVGLYMRRRLGGGLAILTLPLPFYHQFAVLFQAVCRKQRNATSQGSAEGQNRDMLSQWDQP